MKITRNVSRYIHFVLDELLPPIVRDSRFVMSILLKASLQDKAEYFLTFKEKAHQLSAEEFQHYYQETYGILDRETDLNRGCIKRITKMIFDTAVLEVGCGNGFLSKKLAATNKKVTGYDIQITQKQKDEAGSVSYVQGFVEELPFADDSYETVVCSHTLEHVQNLPVAIAQLRRVAKSRLVIVVPCQRPYRYTFDLHIHFFPYAMNIYHAFLPPKSALVTLEKVEGDWLYIEEYE